MTATDPKRPLPVVVDSIVKCPSCRAKVGSEDFMNDPWSADNKTGRGFYLCLFCDKRFVRRYMVSPLTILPLFLAGILSVISPVWMAYLLNSQLGIGQATSFFIGVACTAFLVGGLWLYSFQPVEVTAMST